MVDTNKIYDYGLADPERALEAVEKLEAERDALKAELDIEKNRRELAEEEIEVLGMNLDDIGLPRKTSDTLSIWGRVTFLLDNISSMRAEIEAARKQEPLCYLSKFDKDKVWSFCFKPHYEYFLENPDEFSGYRVLPVYASPVPAQQPEEIAPDIVEAANEVTRALTALRHTRDAFEIGGLIRSDINSICDVLDVTASKLFQIAKGGENEQNQEENTIDAWYARMKGKYL